MFDQQGLAKFEKAVLQNRVTPRHFAFGHPTPFEFLAVND